MDGGLGSPLLGRQPQHRAGHSSQEAGERENPHGWRALSFQMAGMPHCQGADNHRGIAAHTTAITMGQPA